MSLQSAILVGGNYDEYRAKLSRDTDFGFFNEINKEIIHDRGETDSVKIIEEHKIKMATCLVL